MDPLEPLELESSLDQSEAGDFVSSLWLGTFLIF